MNEHLEQDSSPILSLFELSDGTKLVELMEKLSQRQFPTLAPESRVNPLERCLHAMERLGIATNDLAAEGKRCEDCRVFLCFAGLRKGVEDQLSELL